MISHRPNTLGAVDKLLLLREGVVDLFGLRDEVIARITRAAAPLQAVPSTVKTGS
jgi:ABC-type protease/lipase transport system fused ATPase/permease subunit